VIAAMRPLFAVFLALTLLSTLLLYVLSEETETLFAWTIVPPLSAAFLGAGYAAGFVLIAMTMRERLWAHARIALVTVLVFTAVTLVVTLLHLDRFHFDAAGPAARIAAWLWIVVYVVVPPWMALLIRLQSRAPGADPPPAQPMTPWLRALLAVEAIVMLSAGAMLLVDPQWVGGGWPWQLTPLTGRAIGAWLVALGFAAAWAIGERDVRRLRTAATTFVVLGVLQLGALLRFAGDVRWEEPAAWLYLAGIGGILAIGLYGRFARGAARPG
jgi:hypothetical protein